MRTQEAILIKKRDSFDFDVNKAIDIISRLFKIDINEATDVVEYEVPLKMNGVLTKEMLEMIVENYMDVEVGHLNFVSHYSCKII